MNEERSQPAGTDKTEERDSAEPAGTAATEELERDLAAALGAARTDLQEMNDKYLRLYAEFENYKKKAQRDREDLIKYSNESLLYELLPAIDNLEMALKHSAEGDAASLESLREGVENTLRELNRTLGKFGLKPIEALGEPFDPAYHHAMSQVERTDVESNVVVEEFRRGYLYQEKVLRPSLVAVSRKVERS